MASPRNELSQEAPQERKGRDFELTKSLKLPLQKLLVEYKKRESQRAFTLFRSDKSGKLQSIADATDDIQFIKAVETILQDKIMSREGYVKSWFENFEGGENIATLKDAVKEAIRVFGSWLLPAGAQQLVVRSQAMIKDIVSRLALASLGESIALHITQILNFCVQVKKEQLSPSEARDKINALLLDNNYRVVEPPSVMSEENGREAAVSEEPLLDDFTPIVKDQIEKEIEEEEKNKKLDFQNQLMTFAIQVMNILESFEKGENYLSIGSFVELSKRPKEKIKQPEKEGEVELELKELRNQIAELKSENKNQYDEITKLKATIGDFENARYALLSPYTFDKQMWLAEYQSAASNWKVGIGLFSLSTGLGAAAYITVYGFAFVAMPAAWIGIGFVTSLVCIWRACANNKEAGKIKYSINVEMLMETTIDALQNPLGLDARQPPREEKIREISKSIGLRLLLHKLSMIRSTGSIECERIIHNVLVSDRRAGVVDTVAALETVIARNLVPLLNAERGKRPCWGPGLFCEKKDIRLIEALKSYKPVTQAAGR